MRKQIFKKIISMACILSVLSTSLLSITAYANSTSITNQNDEVSTTPENSSSDIYDAFNLKDNAIVYEDTDVNPYGSDKVNILTFSELMITSNLKEGGEISIHDYDNAQNNESIIDVEGNSSTTKNNFIASQSEPIDLLDSGKESYVAKIGVDNSYDRSKDTTIYLTIEDINGNVLYKELISKFVSDSDDFIRSYGLNGILAITSGNYDDDEIHEIAVYAPNNSYNEAPSVYVFDVNVQTNSDATAVNSVSLTKKINLKISDYNKNIENPDYSSDAIQRPVVHLTSGDLTNDDTDELVVTSSYTVLVDKEFKEATKIMVPVTTVFDHVDNGFKDIYSVSNTWTYSTDDNTDDKNTDTKYSSYGSAVIADFDGNETNDLLIAGYDMDAHKNDSDNSFINEDVINLQFVTQSLEDNTFKLNPYRAIGEDEKTGVSVTMNENIADGLRSSLTDSFFIPLPVVPMEAVPIYSDLVQTQIFIGGKIYDYNSATNTYDEKFNSDQIYSKKEKVFFSNDSLYKHKTEYLWIDSIVAGNFYNDERYSNQIIFSVGREGNNFSGYRHEIIVITLDDNGEIINEDVHEVDLDLYYLENIDLTKLDIDSDSVIIDYKSRSQFFSEPEVFAVLQAAPYFTDLVSVDPFYKKDGKTVFGSSSGSTTDTGGKIHVNLHGIIGVEEEVEFILKIGGVKAIGEIGIDLNTEFINASETIHTIEYGSDSRTDRVIMGMIPYIKYEYDMYIPSFDMPTESEYNEECKRFENEDDEIGLENYKIKIETALEEGYEFGQHIDGLVTDYFVALPQEFRESLIEIEIYEEIAEEYGYESIKKEVLKSNAGDPYSYDKSSKDLDGYISAIDVGTNGLTDESDAFVPVPLGGGEVTQKMEHSNEEGYKFEWEASEALDVEFNALGAVFGAGFELGGGTSILKTDLTTTEISGTVAGIPEGTYSDYSYNFNWQFGQWQANINNQNCLVLGYLVDDVTSPPSNVQDLRVLETTDSTATLVWKNPEYQLAEQYVIEIANSDSDYYDVTAIIDSKNSSYVITGLAAGHKFNIRVKAVGFGEESPFTNSVLAEIQPSPGPGVPSVEHLNNFYSHVGEAGHFNLVVTYATDTADATSATDATSTTDATSATDATSTTDATSATSTTDATSATDATVPDNVKISYQWQELGNDTHGVLEWTDMKNETDIKLTIDSTTTDDDGREFRCRITQMVNDLPVTIFSNSAKLIVKYGVSHSTLSLNNDIGTVESYYTYPIEKEATRVAYLNAYYQDSYYKVLRDESNINNYILRNESNYYSVDKFSTTETLINKAIEDESKEITLANLDDLNQISANFIYVITTGQFAGLEIPFVNEVVFEDDDRTIYVAGRPVQVSGVYIEDYRTLYYANEIVDEQETETYYYQEGPTSQIVPANKVFINYTDETGNEYNANDFTLISFEEKYTETILQDVHVPGEEVILEVDIEAITKLDGIIPDGFIRIQSFNSNDGSEEISMIYDVNKNTGSSNKNTITIKWEPKNIGNYIITAEYYDDSGLVSSYSNTVEYKAIKINSIDEHQTLKMFHLDAKDVVRANNPVTLDAYTQVNNFTVVNGQTIELNEVTREDVDLSKVSYKVKLYDEETKIFNDIEEGVYSIENNIFKASEEGEYVITAIYNNDKNIASSAVVEVVQDIEKQDVINFIHNQYTVYMTEKTYPNQLQSNRNAQITYSSSNKSVIMVDSSGNLQPVSDGTATIQAVSTIDGKDQISAEYVVTVVDDTVPIKPADNNNTNNDDNNNEDGSADDNSDDENSDSNTNPNDEGVNTGDNRRITLLIILLSVSVIAVLITLKKRKSCLNH